MPAVDPTMGLGGAEQEFEGMHKRLREEVEKLPSPSTRAGRYAESAGEFMGSPLVYAGPGGLAVKAGTAALAGLGAEAGGEFSEELGGNRGIGRFLGSLIGGSTASTAAGLRRIPTATVPVSEERRAAEAAARLGVEVPRFMTARGAAVPRMAKGIKEIPWAGEPLIEASQNLRTQLEAKTGEIAPATTPDVAGGAAKEGLVKFIEKGADKPVSGAYRHVESMLADPEARVPMTRTLEEVSKIMAERANAKIEGSSGAVSAVTDAVTAPEGMNYRGIKYLRSVIGAKNPQELIAKGLDPEEAKRLYRHMTEDLRSAVEAAGGKPAVAAWEEANTLARVMAVRSKQMAKIVGAKGDAPEEQVFARLLAKAGSKSTADVTVLEKAREAMGPEAWGAFTSGVISKMGRDVQGEFSPDTFVSAYSSLSPKAREMFSPEQKSALDDMLKVSALVKDKISKFANVSKEAHTHAATAMLSAFVGGIAAGNFQVPAGILGSLAGGRLAANFLARPAIVRAANDVGRAQVEGNIWKMVDKSEALQRVVLAEFPVLAEKSKTSRQEAHP
jgi:hypothetical protein